MKFEKTLLLSSAEAQTLLSTGSGGGESSSSVGKSQETEHPFDLRPVCEFEFVRCGQVKKNEYSICLGLVLAARRNSHFPNSETEIFTDFCQKCRFFKTF